MIEATNTAAAVQIPPEAHPIDGLRIVLLEADTDYRLKLADYLRANGLEISVVDTLDEIIGLLHNQEWMVSVINFGTNTYRGLEFLKTSARLQQGPVLVLSDSDDPIDRIVCLELGADDCFAKTMHPREMLARIRVAIRRKPGLQSRRAAPRPAESQAAIPSTGPSSTGWRFSREQRQLTGPDGVPIELTGDQFKLLDILIQHAGEPQSRDQLSRAVFGRLVKAGDRAIDNLVVRLRRKLNEPARMPRIIKTARSGGYLFAGFPEDPGAKPHTIRSERKRAA